MSLISLDDARDQCRVEPDYPAAQLQPYIDAAEAAASAYLNRRIYCDQAAFDATVDGLGDVLLAASAAYADASMAAAVITDDLQRSALLDIADARLEAAKVAADRAIHGIVVNAAIDAAMRLLLGHLFANREDVLTGMRAAAVAVPMGARDLLRPYRRVMMP